MRKNYTIELIRKIFASEGYEILSTEYKNVNTKIDFICPNGHKHSIRWSHWQNGMRCGKCSGKDRLTYDFVKKAFKGEGYTLLSKEYINNKSNLYFVCPVGHNHKTTWSNWKRGHRCSKCHYITLEQVKYSFELEEYTLLSTEYINNLQKIDFICPNGHKHSISWSNWQQGIRCGKCINNIKLSYDVIKQSFESEGYILLSTEYKNAHTKLDFICPNGHRHNIIWNSWQRGNRCGKCSYDSKLEQEMKEYIKSIYSHEFVENDRSIIVNPRTGNNLELDVWIPSMRKAIEFNGYYWHSLEKAKINDEIKAQECNKLGIELLVIKEMDWINERIYCEKNIREFINGH